MQLSQLVQQLGFGLVDGKLFPLDFYRSGCISLSRQQHSRFILIETEKNWPRLEFFSRRRVGVVGHVLEKVTVIAKPPRLFLQRRLKTKRKKKVFFVLTDRHASVTADVLLSLRKRPHVVNLGAHVWRQRCGRNLTRVRAVRYSRSNHGRTAHPCFHCAPVTSFTCIVITVLFYCLFCNCQSKNKEIYIILCL